MIRVYADDDLIFDSRLETDAVLGLPYTAGLNKAGTTSIILPPDHPAYNRFTSHRTLVTVYRDDKLEFRGRAIYPADDFYRRRTITCEGERCFLRDAILRPYLYQAEPAAIFTDVLGQYNAAVDPAKRFVVGTITVTDANDYIRLESSEAEKVSAVVDKLVERCGGYIVFTTNDAGQRVINWLAELGYRSQQVIEFGQNLTDFSRSDDSTGPITRLIPYGAVDESTGQRVTIESVNDGRDYIQDDDAVALRGVIEDAVYWDDVTQPENLLRKAQAHLAKAKNIVTGLHLSAVDLSLMDKNIDTFEVGDLVRVRSKPHGVDEDFLLTDRSGDWLLMGSGDISLGKEVQTLTGSDVAANHQTRNELHKVERIIKADYNLNIAKAVEETKQTLITLIQQTGDSIKLEVSEQYATNGDVESLVSSSMTQLSDSFNFLFSSLEKTMQENDSGAREQFLEIEKYIRFDNGDIILGEAGNSITLRIENDRISFIDGGAEVAYISNKQLVILDGHFLNSLRIGSFKWLPRANGNLSLVKVGD